MVRLGEGTNNNAVERFMGMLGIPVSPSEPSKALEDPNSIPVGERAGDLLKSLAVIAEMERANLARNKLEPDSGLVEHVDERVDDLLKSLAVIAEMEDANLARNKLEPDSGLVEHITVLWNQPDVRESVDAYLHRRARDRWRGSLHTAYRALARAEMGTEDGSTGIQEEYDQLRQTLYLGEITRPDKELAIEAKLKTLAKKLIGVRQSRAELLHLASEQRIPENTDFVAHTKWETLKGYHDQLTTEGFVWLPSRTDIHMKCVASLEVGRWPLLIGEAGTGKSMLATATARTLTGSNPLFYPCTPQTGSRDLLRDREIDQKGSYTVYGPLVQAFTGYENSRQDTPECTKARVVVLDEFTFLTSSAYALIKEARLKKPAKGSNSSGEHESTSYYGHPILKGAAVIPTTNPPGVRYKGRTPLDVALSREFAFLNVDYPPMTVENPELFEFMLSALMDDRGSINVSRVELSPYYEYEDLRSRATLNGLAVKGVNRLVEDPTDPRHGILYRFSFACKSIQDSFVLGNNIDLISDKTLRVVAGKDGVKIDSNGDPLTLSRATITLKDISDMLSSFYSRRLVDDPDYHVDSLSEWLVGAVNNYMRSLEDPLDRDKVRAIFEYYNIFHANSLPTNDFPLSAVEIGYLSPVVPRPLILEEAISSIIGDHTYSFITEDREEVTVTPQFNFDRDGTSIQLMYGDAFMFNNEIVVFVGQERGNRQEGRLAVRKPNSGLVRMVPAIDVIEVPFFWQAESLDFERLVRTVDNNITALKRIGIVKESDTTGELGYMYENRFYRVPSSLEIFKLLYPNLEVLDTKASQGFRLPLLVPYQYPVSEYLKLVNDCFAEYSDRKLLRKNILASSGNPYPLDKPAILAPDNLTRGLLYYPESFFSVGTGVNRNRFLNELGNKGFGIVFIEDFATAPAYSQDYLGGRRQIGPQSCVGDSVIGKSLGFEPSQPEYSAESGMTIADWLTMVSYYLVTGEAPIQEASAYSNLLLLGNSYRDDALAVVFSMRGGHYGYRLGRFKEVAQWVGGNMTHRVLRNVVRIS